MSETKNIYNFLEEYICSSDRLTKITNMFIDLQRGYYYPRERHISCALINMNQVDDPELAVILFLEELRIIILSDVSLQNRPAYIHYFNEVFLPNRKISSIDEPYFDYLESYVIDLMNKA